MRLRSPFFLRLLGSTLVLLAAAMGVIGLLGALRIRAAYLEGKQESLRIAARLLGAILAEDLRPGRAPELGRRMARLDPELGCRITVVTEDGQVLIDTEADPTAMENHRLRPEIVGAAAQGEGVSVRFSHTVRQEMMYLARRAAAADGAPCYVRVAVPIAGLSEHLAPVYVNLALAVALVLGAAALFAFYFTRRYTRPLMELTRLADAYARGEFDQRIHSREGGEPGVLARSLNAMADAQAQLLARVAKGREELLAVLTSMSEGVIATDVEQRVVVVNAAAAALFGLPAGGAQGLPLWELVRDEAVLKAAAAVLADGRPQVFPLGPVQGRFLELSVGPVRAGGRPDGLVILAHDVTEAAHFEEMRREFVANVSHELRTPLTLIKGFVETLREGALGDPVKAPEFLGTIERHVDQLTNLVADLLELSRLERGGGLPDHREVVDVVVTVRRVVELFAPAAAQKRQRVEVEVAPGLPAVAGDPRAVERAVANLVDNAVKYTPEAGSIKVSARAAGVGGAAGAAWVEIEVSDTGIGIPAEDQPRVFERFYRVDKSRSRAMGGTGLGLSIVKHVAQTHGGSVHVASVPGRGATFLLRLPAAQAGG